MDDGENNNNNVIDFRKKMNEKKGFNNDIDIISVKIDSASDLEKELESLVASLQEIVSKHSFGNFLSNNLRPYDGQAHTFFGVRGATEVKFLTLRDLGDAIADAYSDQKKIVDILGGSIDKDALAGAVLLKVESFLKVR
jgi:hypothetical protein